MRQKGHRGANENAPRWLDFFSFLKVFPVFRGRYNFFWRIVVVLSIQRGGIGAWSEGKLVAKKHPYPFLASFEKSRFSQFSPLTQGRHASALIGFRLNLQLLWIQCCVSKQKANSILEQPLFLRSNVLVELSFFQQCLVTWKEQKKTKWTVKENLVCFGVFQCPQKRYRKILPQLNFKKWI